MQSDALSGFEPRYKWPSPSFPFRAYFDSPQLRIFIIENISHNWDWLCQYSKRFQERDYFFVFCGWNHSNWFADQALKTLEVLDLSKDGFFFLYNSLEEQEIFSDRGFSGELINQNAWIDENQTMQRLRLTKKYDAIYVARRTAFKRHMLAEKVSHLAIVAGNNHGNNLAPVPHADYINPHPLEPSEVCEKINESRCGLILSAEEGACFASSEYLLCGIPVVSTSSKGGRDVWYDSYNSIICDPDPQDIADAVAYFKAHPPDPEVIRANHIEEARKHRLRFIEALERILHQHGVRGLDVHRYFYDNFYHKMRKSIKPDFEAIFPPLI